MKRLFKIPARMVTCRIHLKIGSPAMITMIVNFIPIENYIFLNEETHNEPLQNSLSCSLMRMFEANLSFYQQVCNGKK